MAGITLGKLFFPAGLVAACCAIALALAVGNALAGSARARTERLLWAVLAVTVLVARAAFVVRHGALFAQAPLQALDIRDGGFDAVAGIACGALLAGLLAWRNLGEGKALLAATLAGTVAWWAGNALVSAAVAGQRLPDVTLASLAGEQVAMHSFAGRPVVVNLWASWCPPCRREMPALALAQRAHPEAVFVFVNQGETADVVRSYLHDQALAMENVLLDENSTMAHATGSPGLPTTLFFDAHGRLVDRRSGELSQAALAERLGVLQPARVRRLPLLKQLE